MLPLRIYRFRPHGKLSSYVRFCLENAISPLKNIAFVRLGPKTVTTDFVLVHSETMKNADIMGVDVQIVTDMPLRLRAIPIVCLIPFPAGIFSFFRSLASIASKGFPSEYYVCVRLHSESSEPAMFSQTMSDKHPPTPPPSRWPALFTLRILAKFHLVWRRLCDVVLFPSCLFEHTLTVVCVLPEYRSGSKYNIQSHIFVTI